ncbi:hypothetical protein RvY_11591 [Ramazzottius varieornatus]|uniref:Uncharacterized protein n=1 Tax=Ramazzottius varieornatus TaxID=947166 RepID=A0A1D1VIP0_RAMVA|nr:hypothetical protein RvY_11591 [Ramazzottius varieornatus]
MKEAYVDLGMEAGNNNEDSPAEEAEGQHLSHDFTVFSKPLTYSTERVHEPVPPTWRDLLEDLSLYENQDPIFRNTRQGTATSERDPLSIAHISLEVQVAAKNLAALKETAKERLQSSREALEILKDDLEDLT